MNSENLRIEGKEFLLLLFYMNTSIWVKSLQNILEKICYCC